MKLFNDQPLGATPHIAVFSSNKVGNFVVITPLLRGLKNKYPHFTIDFFGSDITADFENHCPYIDWRFSLFSPAPNFLESLTDALRQRRQRAREYDLAINCDEFSEINLVMVSAIRPKYIAGAGLAPDFIKKLDCPLDPLRRLLKDPDWNSADFVQRHAPLVDSNYIAEIFCRIAQVKTDFFRLEVPFQPPDFPVPDVLLHVTATRAAKQWPLSHWLTVIRWCEAQDLQVGLIGSRPALQASLYHSDDLEASLLSATNLIDLRGKTNLTQLAGALKQTKLCLTLDTGPLHIAAAVGCPTVAIFGNAHTGEGASPLRLWAPRLPWVKLALSDYACTLCQDAQFKNDACLLPDHDCMVQVSPQTVIDLAQTLLA